MREYRVIDCFCGAGGLSLGFAASGFKTVYAFDSDEACINTYRENHGQYAFVRDAYNVGKQSMESDIGHPLEAVDVMIGGPPCQGFSVQRRGSNSDLRNNLVLEYIRLILDIMPRFFVMENVGGLLSPRGIAFYDKLVNACEGAGYVIQKAKLNAFDYGVPQNRKRVFIVGELTMGGKSIFSFPKPTRDTTNAPATVREAIYDLMERGETDIPNHKADKLSAINLERIQSVREGEGRDSLPSHLQLDCHKGTAHRHLDVYGRMFWDKPSSTITARFDSFSRGRFGHPQLDRTVTLREGARLQSFPDDFIFLGSKVQVAKQIGNAVPPLLAAAIAQRIKECL